MTLTSNFCCLLLLVQLVLFLRIDCADQSWGCVKSPVFLQSSYYEGASYNNNDNNNTRSRSRSRDSCSVRLRHTHAGFERSRKTLKDFSLTVLFTSDLHGHLRHIPKLAALKERLRAQGQPVLLLDVGDISVGSIFERYYGYRGSYEILEAAGYDAVALGTHDNLGNMHSAPNESLPQHSLPILSLTPPPAYGRFVLPSTIINASGVMVGVIGYSPPASGSSSGEEGGNETLHVNSNRLVKKIIAEASCLRRYNSVDIVILLAHRGLMADLTPSHVDVVLSSPSPLAHTEVERCAGQEEWQHRPNLPFIVHAGHNAKQFGNITIVAKQMESSLSKGGSVHRKLALSSSLADVSILPTPAKTMEVSTLLAKRRRDVVSRSSEGGTQPLFDFDEQALPWDSGRNCRSEPCFTGRVITSAILDYFNCSTEYVLFESGSIRENFHFTITEESLCHALPDNSSLVRLRLPVEVLKTALERSIHSKGSGKYLQVAVLNTPITATATSLLAGSQPGGQPREPGVTLTRKEAATQCVPASGLHADMPPTRTLYGVDAALARVSSSSRQEGEGGRVVEVIMTDWLASNRAYNFSSGVVLASKHEADYEADVSGGDVVRDIVRRYFLLLSHPQPHSLTSRAQHSVGGGSGSRYSSDSDGNHSASLLTTRDGGGPPTASHHASGSDKLKSSLTYYESLIAFVSECIAISVSNLLLTPGDQTRSPGRKRKSYSMLVISMLASVSHWLVFSVRILASAVYWPLYYNILRVYNFTFGVGSVVISAKRGFIASLVSASLVTLVSNPFWVGIAHINMTESRRKISCRNLCDGLSYNMLLILTPCIKMFFFEMFMAIILTDSQSEADTGGVSMLVLLSSLLNGVCGCVASLISTCVTYHPNYPCLPLTSQAKTKTNLYETAITSATSPGSGPGGLKRKLWAAGVYDFISFFSYKIFFAWANISPYSYEEGQMDK